MKKIILFLILIFSTLSFASPKTIVRVCEINPQEKLEITINKIVKELNKLPEDVLELQRKSEYNLFFYDTEIK